MVLEGKAKPVGKNKVVKLAKGQFVELAFEGEDQILTLLGEFGTQQANTHPSHPPHGGTPGPLHNQIPKPDRAVDNTTIWVEDFSQAHYDNLLYNEGHQPVDGELVSRAVVGRLQRRRLRQRLGRASRTTRPRTAATTAAASSAPATSGGSWRTRRTAWCNAMVAVGQTRRRSNALLAPFDVWDRYDYDGDGNFDEPDGYIDHFQSVHAGEGEETGWRRTGQRRHLEPPLVRQRRHRPASAPRSTACPTWPMASDSASSKYWIGDYTIEPENGGVGCLRPRVRPRPRPARSRTTPAATPAAPRTRPAGGRSCRRARTASVNGDDLGSAPTHFGAWEKFQLGFLKSYEASGTPASRHVQPRPGRVQHQAAAGDVHRPAGRRSSRPTSATPTRAADFYHSGVGRRARQHDDEVDHPRRWADQCRLQGQVPHRDLLGLRVPAGVRRTVARAGRTSTPPCLTPVTRTARTTVRASPASPVSPRSVTAFAGEPAWVDVTADLSAYANSTVDDPLPLLDGRGRRR